jgi:hypothetical protein
MLFVVLVFMRSVFRLLVIANIPSLSILVIPMMEAIHSSETSVLRRDTRRYISEDGVLHNIRCENLITYIFVTLLIYFTVSLG